MPPKSSVSLVHITGRQIFSKLNKKRKLDIIISRSQQFQQRNIICDEYGKKLMYLPLLEKASRNSSSNMEEKKKNNSLVRLKNFKNSKVSL